MNELIDYAMSVLSWSIENFQEMEDEGEIMRVSKIWPDYPSKEEDFSLTRKSG